MPPVIMIRLMIVNPIINIYEQVRSPLGEQSRYLKFSCSVVLYNSIEKPPVIFKIVSVTYPMTMCGQAGSKP